MTLLLQWKSRHSCTKRQLQSLLGSLNFICSVCRPGRTFLRRMIALLSRARKPNHHIRLTTAFRRDIVWWTTFLPQWNGRCFFSDDQWVSNTVFNLYTDASKDGFGAYFNGHWFYGSFTAIHIPIRRSIAFKELYAIALAVITWSSSLANKRILFHCDNKAVVQIINYGASKCSHIMSIMRSLFFTCANHNIEIRAVHIPGIDNNIADSLSRFQILRFRDLAPTADLHQTPFQLPQLCY